MGPPLRSYVPVTKIDHPIVQNTIHESSIIKELQTSD